MEEIENNEEGSHQIENTSTEGDDIEEGVDDSDEEIFLGDNLEKLLVEPKYVEGVASAYRYKLVIMNEELYASAFNFIDDVDVFSFASVNKKRAAKKEEWPFEAPMHHPQRCDVKIQLFAGKTEIKNCSGCSTWKELTTKPFLVLTPQGGRCIQFLKQPFVLIIFRCCPKFHSFAKQFKLVITLTCVRSGKKYSTCIKILRKKMNKKRKGSPNTSNLLSNDEDSDPIVQKKQLNDYKQNKQLSKYAKKEKNKQEDDLNSHNNLTPSLSISSLPIYQASIRNIINTNSLPLQTDFPKTSSSSNLQRINNSPFGNGSWGELTNFLETESRRVQDSLKNQNSEKLKDILNAASEDETNRNNSFPPENEGMNFQYKKLKTNNNNQNFATKSLDQNNKFRGILNDQDQLSCIPDGFEIKRPSRDVMILPNLNLQQTQAIYQPQFYTTQTQHYQQTEPYQYNTFYYQQRDNPTQFSTYYYQQKPPETKDQLNINKDQ